MNIELNACPYCHSPDVGMQIEKTRTAPEYQQNFAYVKCRACNARSEQYYEGNSPSYVQKAASDWNKLQGKPGSGVKMYCLQPGGYGPESYFVMAETVSDAMDAFYKFQSSEDNENYRFARSREEFDEYVRAAYLPIKQLGIGEVEVNANQ